VAESSRNLRGVLCLAAAALATTLATGGPRLLVERTEIDLGTVARGRTATARFEVANPGDRDLHVLSVESECSCTVVEHDETIRAGGVGALVATLDTSGVKGRMRRIITLRTDDPSQPSTTLALKANVVASVDVLPSKEVFLRTRPGHPAAARVIVRRDETEQGRLVIRDVVASAPWIDVTATELTEHRPPVDGLPEAFPGDWLLELGVRGWPSVGRSHETVKFSTGLSREPTVTIPLDVELRPPVNVSAVPIVLQAGPGGSGRSMVVLSVRDGLDPRALAVETTPPELAARLEPAGGRMYRMYVEWAARGAGAGRVKLRVGNEVFEVPVEWAEPAAD
jgi:hypothetical protein